jgi:hypothetical protein
MRDLRRFAFAAVAAPIAVAACVGTTGGQLVSFPAAAAGPADAPTGKPFEFVSDMGWEVTLTLARLHVGAVYLDQSFPVSGAQGTQCILPATYVGQVTSGLDVDLLSPALQPFPAPGSGTTIPPALAAQVWLTGGDVNSLGSPSPPTAVLVLAGTAVMGATAMPFSGRVTIDENRQSASQGAAGGDPICKERIVSPIRTSLAIGSRGGLVLRVDPRRLFVNVNFGLLTPSGGGFVFSDDPTSVTYTQPSRNLFLNLTATAPYTFSWDDDL